MKRLFACVLALFSAAAFAVTYTPISTLQPAGSTSGQVVTSTGPTSAPAWGGISAATLTGVVSIANGGTGQSTAAAALTALGGLSTTTAASTYATITNLNLKAALSGALFTGAINLSYSGPILTLNDTSGTNQSTILLQNNGTTNWQIQRSSANNFNLQRYVSGAFVDNPFSVSNSTGVVTFTQRPVFSGSTPWDSGNLPNVAGRLLNIRVFTTSGTYTPSTGTAAVYVKVQAGGGAGGGTPVTNASQAAAGSGGGAGSYAEGYYTTGFAGVTVAVGGSAAGVSGAAGTVGNASSFGSLISCPGGNGGLLGNAATGSFTTASPSNAGACTGTVLFGETGTAGDESIVISSTVSSSGRGGSSIFGQGAPQRWSVGAGIGTSKYGAGGSGANASVSTAAQAGGSSAPGIVEVFEFSQ